MLGLVLLAAEQVGASASATRAIDAQDGIAIGLAQALALIPGVSRSGATITAGLFLGLDRTAAARFSFLLSVPAVVLVGLFELRRIVGDEGTDTASAALAVATAVRVHHRLRGDRLAAAVPDTPLDDRVRGLPSGAGRARARADAAGAIKVELGS